MPSYLANTIGRISHTINPKYTVSHMDGWAKDCGISIALAMEIQQSCTIWIIIRDYFTQALSPIAHRNAQWPINILQICHYVKLTYNVFQNEVWIIHKFCKRLAKLTLKLLAIINKYLTKCWTELETLWWIIINAYLTEGWIYDNWKKNATNTHTIVCIAHQKVQKHSSQCQTFL